MYNRRKRRKKSQIIPPRGIRLSRKKNTDPALDTLSGVKVRSRYEQECVRILKNNNIEFKYEPLMLLNGRQFRPDFFLPEYELFIEICGYDRFPFYRDRNALKERIYRANGLNVAFIHYDGKGRLVEVMNKELAQYSIELG